LDEKCFESSSYESAVSQFLARVLVKLGRKLLENEMRTYTWHGDTFEEAFKKVSERQ
jgi:hypothetical protein